jgi:hypothetical protein
MDFRRNRITRLAYLTLKCLALFSLIWIAFSIHPSWGIPVLIAFGILAGQLDLHLPKRDNGVAIASVWRFPVKRYFYTLLHLFILLALSLYGLPKPNPSPLSSPTTVPVIYWRRRMIEMKQHHTDFIDCPGYADSGGLQTRMDALIPRRGGCLRGGG